MIMHVITNLVGLAGAETMLCRLLQVSQDEKIIVVSLMDVSERNRALAGNANVTFISLKANSPVRLVGALFRLAAQIRREKPQAILCWMYHAMAIGCIAHTLSRTRASLFWNIRQSLDDPAALTASTRAALWICCLFSGCPRGVIYNSARARDLHAKYGYRNHNAVVIPNGFVMPSDVAIVAKRPSVFGIVGRLHPQKDHGNFFAAAAIAAAQRPGLRFRAAGHGLTAQNSDVLKMVRSAGLAEESIELCGELQDMGLFYASIDALVLSSRSEGFPNVVAEAMSHGKPVITTDVGDAAAIVGNTGWVVPPGDSRKLASAMHELLQLDPAAYARKAEGARQRVMADYNLHDIARRYERFVHA